MTRAQKALQRGRRVTEANRGVMVTITPGNVSVLATVEPWTPESSPNTPSQETRVTSLVKVARDLLSEAGITVLIGHYFVNQFTNERYRVVKIFDNAQDIRIVYHCETSNPA